MTQSANNQDPVGTSVDSNVNEVTEVRGERRTGPRVKQANDADDLDALELTRPEAFRKPFASLPPSSDLEGDALFFARANAISTSSIAPTSPQGSIRPKNVNTYCARHKLAKNRLGQCMMCEREAKSSADDLNWKLPVILVALAVTLGVLFAAYL